MYRWARNGVPAVIDEEIQEGATVVVRFEFENLEYIANWILRYGDSAEVVAPQALQQLIKARAEKIIEQYA